MIILDERTINIEENTERQLFHTSQRLPDLPIHFHRQHIAHTRHIAVPEVAQERVAAAEHVAAAADHAGAVDDVHLHVAHVEPALLGARDGHAAARPELVGREVRLDVAPEVDAARALLHEWAVRAVPRLGRRVGDVVGVGGGGGRDNGGIDKGVSVE